MKKEKIVKVAVQMDRLSKINKDTRHEVRASHPSTMIL